MPRIVWLIGAGIAIFILLLLWVLKNQTQAQTDEWQKNKPLFLAALESGKRVKTGLPVSSFLGQAETLDQAEEIIRLAILTTDIDYHAGILPALGLYMQIFEGKAEIADNSTRRKIFLKEINGLLLILNTLDEQIRMGHYFKTEMALRNRSSWNQSQYHGPEIGTLEKILAEAEKLPMLSLEQMEKFLARFKGVLEEARTACFEESFNP